MLYLFLRCRIRIMRFTHTVSKRVEGKRSLNYHHDELTVWCERTTSEQENEKEREPHLLESYLFLVGINGKRFAFFQLPLCTNGTVGYLLLVVCLVAYCLRHLMPPRSLALFWTRTKIKASFLGVTTTQCNNNNNNNYSAQCLDGTTQHNTTRRDTTRQDASTNSLHNNGVWMVM